MTIRTFVFILIVTFDSSFVHSKTYKRCEFIRELIQNHNFIDEHAAKVSCIAEGALFETDRVTYHHDQNLTYNSNTSPNYGIFQISSAFWCSETGVGGICKMNCKDLVDEDISDDIACLRKIIPSLDGDFDWLYPWNTIFPICNWETYLEQCQGNKEILEAHWNSLDDCMSKFPPLEFSSWILGFSGTPALKHEFPHAAAIGWSRPEFNDIKWACGGSLITEDTVLTAAHCTFDPNNKAPDFVRLGDLNLQTDDDDKDTQQVGILSIIRHPEYKKRYNDIALIKLKSKVNVTKFVMPTCLWNEHEIPRDVPLEACGFGQTQYLGDISPILNKVIVSQINRDNCSQYYEVNRILNHGIVDSIHLCAYDTTGRKMDTCEGDSGGPLEMKLMYYDTIIPFIVGVTAFGQGCGFDAPGVYSRISSYINWIGQNVPELEVNPLKCSQKYKDLRFQKDLSLATELRPQKFVLGNLPNQKTSTTIISEQFLITTASSIRNLSNANRVQIADNSSLIMIDKIVNHPNYVEGNSEYDIALIKLKSRIRWNSKDYPSCISRSISKDYGIQQEYFNDPKIKSSLFRPTELLSDKTYCLGKNDSHFLTDKKYICLKSDVHHVPNACNVPNGSPIIQHVGSDKYSHFETKTLIKGLAVQSDDCTFTLAINLPEHYDWINSVVFKSESKVTEDTMSFNFRDSDLFLGDKCVQYNGKQGSCKRRENCGKLLTESQLICADDTICC